MNEQHIAEGREKVNVIHNENCLTGLKSLPDNSIDCCVTSPPYFGLRDYGTSEQIGLEETPELFVSKLVEVFTEVKRVLKASGTLWLNLGDSYGAVGGDIFTGFNERYSGTGIGGMKQADIAKAAISAGGKKRSTGLVPKNLLGIPWRVAFALQASGWILRQDIIWHKPNPMPESVTDRCTKSHEYIFLLSKSQKYFYDHEAIKQPAAESSIQRLSQDIENQKGSNRVPGKTNGTMKAAGRAKSGYIATAYAKPQSEQRGLKDNFGIDEKANKRSVWTVNTMPYSEAHFATFPERLIIDCIKAGCPEGGIVLDPFMGAGTTGLVARKLGRNFIGFELNAEYIKIAEKRLQNELGMFL